MECTDHFVSGEVFSISICADCGFNFTSPRPTIQSIGPYYESDAYVSHSKTGSGLVNRLFHLARIYTIRYKKSLVKKLSSGKTLLDYGCGTGEFLHAMSRSGWTCRGIEPNQTARDSASRTYHLNISDENALDSLPDGSFDAITLWHVLEHVYPLRERIRSFHRLLDKKGMLFVALPNMLSYDAAKYGSYWAAWDVPRHIHHFSPDTIRLLMQQERFELVKTKPMLLDAIYVSMLSEKYMKGRQRFSSALITGLRSNISAFFGKGNYSSLIYIFKKSE